MRRRRKIKILATLGPSSNTPETIEQLFRAGADIFRINMSHTSHDAMRALVEIIRGVEAKYDRPIGILADLQGPKLRIGTFEGETVDAADADRPSSSTATSDPATASASIFRIRRSSRRLSPATASS